MTSYTRAEQPEDDGHSADGEHRGSYGAWRSMETAPKDGTEILACWPKRKLDDEDAPTGEIVSYAQCVTEWQGFWIEPDYLDAHGSYFLEDEAFADQPTHWMPLPPAPTGADTEGTGLMSPDGVSPAPAPDLAALLDEAREALTESLGVLVAAKLGRWEPQNGRSAIESSRAAISRIDAVRKEKP